MGRAPMASNGTVMFEVARYRSGKSGRKAHTGSSGATAPVLAGSA